MTFGLNLLIGFEADALRRWALDRKGWQMLGSVSGRTVDECERRFFDGWLPSQPILRPSGDGTLIAAPPLAGARLVDGSAGLTRKSPCSAS